MGSRTTHGPLGTWQDAGCRPGPVRLMLEEHGPQADRDCLAWGSPAVRRCCRHLGTADPWSQNPHPGQSRHHDLTRALALAKVAACLPRTSFGWCEFVPRGAKCSPYFLRALMRVKVFIDFWNFQLSWNERTQSSRCDWPRVATVFCTEASRIISGAGLGTLALEETRIYAGYEAGREQNLKRWLETYLDRLPGVRVTTSERHWRQQSVHCRSCDISHARCPNPECGAFFGKAAEKTIDARIVTDLIGLAWEGTYDVAVLVSADKDFIPAVELLQTKNFKVVNAMWRGRGFELAKKCWASFEIDPLIASLIR